MRIFGLFAAGLASTPVMAGLVVTHSVPEPDMFTLIAAGAVGLAALLGARKR